MLECVRDDSKGRDEGRKEERRKKKETGLGGGLCATKGPANQFCQSHMAPCCLFTVCVLTFFLGHNLDTCCHPLAPSPPCTTCSSIGGLSLSLSLHLVLCAMPLPSQVHVHPCICNASPKLHGYIPPFAHQTRTTAPCPLVCESLSLTCVCSDAWQSPFPQTLLAC